MMIAVYCNLPVDGEALRNILARPRCRKALGELLSSLVMSITSPRSSHRPRDSFVKPLRRNSAGLVSRCHALDLHG